MAADPGHLATFIVLTPLARMAQSVSLAVPPALHSRALRAPANITIPVSHRLSAPVGRVTSPIAPWRRR